MPGDDHEAGYGKPPKRHRFKPGQSGNPKGRPRKTAMTLQAEVLEVLGSKLEITKDGKRQRVTMCKAIVMSLLTSIAKGNFSDLKYLFQLLPAAVSKEEGGKDFLRLLCDPGTLAQTSVAGSTSSQPTFRGLPRMTAATLIAEYLGERVGDNLPTLQSLAHRLDFARTDDLEREAEIAPNGDLIKRAQEIMRETLLAASNDPKRRHSAISILKSEFRWSDEGFRPSAREIAQEMRALIAAIDLQEGT